MTGMRIWVAGLLLVAGLALPGRGWAQVTEFRLENGMQVVVIEDHRAPVVTHMVWYRVGAADEPWGRSGIAHFLEHLMFKATENLEEGEFSRTVAANGGQGNAFTSYDYTGYYQRIAADRLGLVMGMEAERMVNLKLTETAVETERAVILEERNQRTENNPQGLFDEQVRAALYLNHPYGLPVIGWLHEIEALGRADAEAFYDRFYAPDNAILVVAGDMTPDAVRRLAETHYGPLAPSGRPPEARPQEPPQRTPRRVEMRDPRVNQPQLSRLYQVPQYDSANPRGAAALDLAADLLGRGITSRLAQALEVEQGVAVDTGAYYRSTRQDPTEFAVYAVPAAGKDLAAVEAAIDAVIAEFAAEGPGAEELARAKRLTRAAYVYAQDDQAARARLYGAALSAGYSVTDVANWPDVIDAVTAEEVRNAVATYLVAERSVTGWLMGDGEKGS